MSFQWLDAVDDNDSSGLGSGEDVSTSTTPSEFGSGRLGSGDLSEDYPDVILQYGSGEVTVQYGSGEVTDTAIDNLTALPQTDDTIDDKMLSEVFAVLTMVIMIAGTVGNGMAILILCRRSLRHMWISVFLTTLCLADTVSLWAFFLEALAQIVSPLLHTWLCKVVILVSSSAGMISSWTIASMCIHLVLNVTDPFIGQISRKNLYKIVSILTFIPVGICLHLLWTTKMDEIITLGCIYDTKYSQFMTVWHFIDASLTTYIPVLIILFSIAVIIYTIKLLPTMDKSIKMISLDITKMCLFTSLSFVLLTIVSAVLTTCIKYIHNDYKHGPSKQALYENEPYSNMYVAQTAFLLVSYLRNALNVIIFTYSGKLFHEEIKLVFCWKNNSNSEKYMYKSGMNIHENTSSFEYTPAKENYDTQSLETPESHWQRDSLLAKRSFVGNESMRSQVALLGGFKKSLRDSITSAALLRRQRSNDTASIVFDPIRLSQESLGNISPDEGFIGVFPCDSGSDISSNSEQNLFPMVCETALQSDSISVNKSALTDQIGVHPCDSGSDISSNSEQNLFPMVCETALQSDSISVSKSELTDQIEVHPCDSGSDISSNLEQNLFLIICETALQSEYNSVSNTESTGHKNETGLVENTAEMTATETQDTEEKQTAETSEAEDGKDQGGIDRKGETTESDTKQDSDLSNEEREDSAQKHHSDLLKDVLNKKDSWRESGIVSDSDEERRENEAAYEQSYSEILRNRLERNVSWASPLIKSTKQDAPVKQDHFEFLEETTRL